MPPAEIDLTLYMSLKRANRLSGELVKYQVGLSNTSLWSQRCVGVGGSIVDMRASFQKLMWTRMWSLSSH